jgi:hypothetical protein
MNKFYTFLSVIALASFGATAQTNLVVNGGFENWTNNTTPENFTARQSPPINNFLTKEATTVHSGSFSAKHQSQSAAQYVEGTQLIDVLPGHSYTMSYWYLDNSTTAKTRIWSSWMTGTTPVTALPDNADVLRPASETDTEFGFSTDSPNWVQKTVTLNSPANATKFRFQVRTYKQSNDAIGGFIYYDDFVFTDNGTAGIAKNTISGLKMFPNPASGDVLNIVSDSADAKTVVVYDVLGKKVIDTKVANETVNIGALHAGVYLVNITEAGKSETRKLVVN